MKEKVIFSATVQNPRMSVSAGVMVEQGLDRVVYIVVSIMQKGGAR